MKRLALYLLLSYLIPFALSAQHLNLAWQPEFFNRPHRIEPFADGWMVASELFHKAYTSHGPHLTRIGPQGILWRKRWMDGIPNSLYAFAVLPENRVAISGFQGSCDTSGDPFFIVFNADGEEIFVKADEPFTGNQTTVPRVNEVRGLSNGGYLGTNIAGAFTMDDTLGYRSTVASHYPEWLYYLAQSSDTSFWAGKYNMELRRWKVSPLVVRNYWIREEPGWATIELLEGEELLDLKTFEGVVYALTQTSIWENRPPYKAPAGHPLPSSGRDYFKLHRTAGAFFLLGADGQGRANVMQMDTAFNFVNQWTYGSSIFSPADFAVRGDTIAILGQLTIPADGRFFSGMYQRAPAEANTLVAVKTFGFDGSTQPPLADVAITGISWAGASAVMPSYCSVEDCGQLHRVGLEGIFLTVRNNSPSTINSLVLNTRRPYCYDCFAICEFEQAYWQRYEGLELLPGQEITLSFDQPVEFRAQYFDSDFELCFWVSDADGHLEKDYDNNLYCEMLPLEAVGVSEEAWSLYPNPVRDDLRILFHSATTTKAVLRVYNAAGRQVRLSPLPVQSLSYRLPVEGLPAGLYLLVWETGKKQAVKRFVKW